MSRIKKQTMEHTWWLIWLMPRPSARTKYFLSRTILKLSRTKILSRVKKSIFSFQKSIKMKFPDWKSICNNKYSFCMTFESKKCNFWPWTKILSWTISVLSRTKNILSKQKDEALIIGPQFRISRDYFRLKLSIFR